MAAATHATPEAAHDVAAHGGEHAAVPFPPFNGELFPSQLFWFAVTFGLLYLFVSRFVLPKVGAVLEKRAGTLKTDLDLAHREGEAAERARQDAERTHAAARANSRNLIEDMRTKAQAELTAEREKADAEMGDKIAAAEASISERRNKALADVDAIAKDVAGEIVARLGAQRGAGSAKKVRA